MRIAFVAANREQLPDPVVPLGLLYVIAATDERHDRQLWDLCFEPEPLGALAERLDSFEPEVVAIGLRNIQNSDYTGTHNNLAFYEQVLATVRAHSDALVVLGGGGFSILPEQLMATLKPDFGIAGEGEAAFAQLIGVLDGAQPRRSVLNLGAVRSELSCIGNLLFFDGEELVRVARQSRFQLLDALAVPSRALVDSRYYSETGIEPVQTKRGCALHCDYCTYPIIEGRKVRTRDPGAVVDEMTEIAANNPAVSHFFLVDSVFNIPPAHARAVCRNLAERGPQLAWTCYANPLGFNAELAELMRRAGCSGLEIGTDSGCDEVLKRLRKGFNTAQVRRTHALCADAGLRDCHTFLLGTPGESLDDVKRTLDFIVEMAPFAAVLMAYVDDDEVVDAAVASSRRELRERVLELLGECRHAFPRWIIPPLGVNFRRRFFRYLRRQGLRGPLWQQLDRLARRAGRDGDQAAAPPEPAAPS